MKWLKNKVGLVWMEVLIVLGIIGILIVLFIPPIMQHYNIHWVW